MSRETEYGYQVVCGADRGHTRFRTNALESAERVFEGLVKNLRRGEAAPRCEAPVAILRNGVAIRVFNGLSDKDRIRLWMKEHPAAVREVFEGLASLLLLDDNDLLDIGQAVDGGDYIETATDYFERTGLIEYLINHND